MLNKIGPGYLFDDIMQNVMRPDLEKEAVPLPSFDVVISLEVGEHLPEAKAGQFLDTVTSH